MVTACAVITARNEDLHLARCISNLITNGIDIVLIDHDSEDRSGEVASTFLDRGLLSIERLPWNGMFSLKSQLEAKQRVIARLTHEWVLHVDADEALSPPWPNTRLIDAINKVDAAGYDCINFDEMTFVAWPHEDFWNPDYAQKMKTYYFFEPEKMRLMRAWKRCKDVSNVAFGGHRLSGTLSVFPENFILRHYMALSADYLYQKYARRVFESSELAAGWHHSEKIWRIGITREMSKLKLAKYVKVLPTVDSVEFDRSCPADTHYWRWAHEAESGFFCYNFRAAP